MKVMFGMIGPDQELRAETMEVEKAAVMPCGALHLIIDNDTTSIYAPGVWKYLHCSRPSELDAWRAEE